MGQPFSPERLAAIRRIRKARRLFKREPLFAYSYMLESFPEYTHEQFLDDLRLRTKRKLKPKKDGRMKYGRYKKMQELIEQYLASGNMDDLLNAQKLKEHLKKPYRVCERIRNECTLEYGFSPFIPIREIESLVASLSSCKTESEADTFVDAFRESTRLK
jgi:hypothetical protein